MHSSNVQYQPRLVSTVPVATPTPTKPLAAPLRPERVLGHRRSASNESRALRELNVSGVRVLLALGLAVGLVGLFLWGVVRDWLFAQ